MTVAGGAGTSRSNAISPNVIPGPQASRRRGRRPTTASPPSTTIVAVAGVALADHHGAGRGTSSGISGWPAARWWLGQRREDRDRAQQHDPRRVGQHRRRRGRESATTCTTTDAEQQGARRDERAARSEPRHEQRRRGRPDRQPEHLEPLLQAEDARQHIVPDAALEERARGDVEERRAARPPAINSSATGERVADPDRGERDPAGREPPARWRARCRRRPASDTRWPPRRARRTRTPRTGSPAPACPVQELDREDRVEDVQHPDQEELRARRARAERRAGFRTELAEARERVAGRTVPRSPVRRPRPRAYSRSRSVRGAATTMNAAITPSRAAPVRSPRSGWSASGPDEDAQPLRGARERFAAVSSSGVSASCGRIALCAGRVSVTAQLDSTAAAYAHERRRLPQRDRAPRGRPRSGSGTRGRARSRRMRSPSTEPNGATSAAGTSWATSTSPAVAAPPRSNAYTMTAIHTPYSGGVEQK